MVWWRVGECPNSLSCRFMQCSTHWIVIQPVQMALKGVSLVVVISGWKKIAERKKMRRKKQRLRRIISTSQNDQSLLPYWLIILLNISFSLSHLSLRRLYILLSLFHTPKNQTIKKSKNAKNLFKPNQTLHTQTKIFEITNSKQILHYQQDYYSYHQQFII